MPTLRDKWRNKNSFFARPTKNRSSRKILGGLDKTFLTLAFVIDRKKDQSLNAIAFKFFHGFFLIGSDG